MMREKCLRGVLKYPYLMTTHKLRHTQCTLVVAIAGHQYISVHTPTRSPRIANNPIRYTCYDVKLNLNGNALTAMAVIYRYIAQR